MASNVTETNGTSTRKEASKPAGAARTAPGARKDGVIEKIRRYLHEVVVELKKTTWPAKQELFNSTKVVLGTVIVVGVFIALTDWLLTQLTGALGFWK